MQKIIIKNRLYKNSEEDMTEQAEFCQRLIGKKGKEVLLAGYEKYDNLEVYGYKFYSESPNPFIVFKCKNWKAKLINAICFKGYPICKENIK